MGRSADLGADVSDLPVRSTQGRQVFAATDGGLAREGYTGIWRSVDGGNSWAPYNDGLESSELCVFDLEMSKVGDRLYAGTLGGLLARSPE